MLSPFSFIRLFHSREREGERERGKEGGRAREREGKQKKERETTERDTGNPESVGIRNKGGARVASPRVGERSK